MKKIILSVVVFATITYSYAQNAYDVYRYSKTSSLISTARVSAMGGAYTSLGADISSMSINPAGLALYKSDEVAITPTLKIASSNSQTDFNTKDSKTFFGLNNFGAVFNFINSEKYLIRGLSLGISYNKQNNGSMYLNSMSGYDNNSIVYHYASQLNAMGATPNDLIIPKDNPYAPYHKFPSGSQWGAISALNNGLIEWSSDAPYDYRPDARSFAKGDTYSHSQTTFMKNYSDSYNVALGMKFGNFISVGVNFGLASYYSLSKINYTETANVANPTDYKELRQWEAVRQSGTAFDFKVGTIIEPAKGLRLGLAYHAPRVTKINEAYYIDQEAFYKDNTSFYTESAIKESSYQMQSPSKLLTGVSYMFSGRGIISFDWKRTFWTGMKTSGLMYLPGETTIEQVIQNNYSDSDEYSVGAEFYVGSGMFVRGGYSYVESPFKQSLIDNMNFGKFDESVQTYSLGFGFKARTAYVDLTYLYQRSNLMPYEYVAIVSNTELSNHFINVTVGFKF